MRNALVLGILCWAAVACGCAGIGDRPVNIPRNLASLSDDRVAQLRMPLGACGGVGENFVGGWRFVRVDGVPLDTHDHPLKDQGYRLVRVAPGTHELLFQVLSETTRRRSVSVSTGIQGNGWRLVRAFPGELEKVSTVAIADENATTWEERWCHKLDVEVEAGRTYEFNVDTGTFESVASPSAVEPVASPSAHPPHP